MYNKLQELRSGTENGFTAIEVFLVVATIMFLAVIAIPAFIRQHSAFTGNKDSSDAIENWFLAQEGL